MMSEFKGHTVEIRYTDDDYSRVWVVLPNGEICESSLISPTSLINPNKQTLKAVRDARAHERKLIRDFDLLKQSQLRGETSEDRVMYGRKSLGKEKVERISPRQQPGQAVVHKMTRMDRKKHFKLHKPGVSLDEASVAQADELIFDTSEQEYVSEFDGDTPK